MVAHKEEERPKSSAWLHKTQSRYKGFSRGIWLCGLLIVCLIGGGIGLALYLTHKNPAHSIPVAIGGSAHELSITPAGTTTRKGTAFTPGPDPGYGPTYIPSSTSTKKHKATATPDAGTQKRDVVEAFVARAVEPEASSEAPSNDLRARDGSHHRVSFKSRVKSHPPTRHH